MRRIWWPTAILALIAITGAGCGGSSGHHAAAASAATQGTGSGSASLVAVDCSAQRGYVALLDNVAGNNDGQVEVLDLSVDPDATSPHVATIDIGHPDYPNAAVLDAADGLLIVSSGQNGNGGFLDLISTTTNAPIAGSPFAYPTGSDTRSSGGVLFDAAHNKVIVATSDDASCSSAGTCTGFAVFDMSTKTFGPVIVSQTGYEADNFALNTGTDLVLNVNDSNVATGQLEMIDLASNTSCLLSDGNILDAEDAAGVDPTTNIWVTGNDDTDDTATVINLNGSSLSGTGTSSCTVNEGGTPPNSVRITNVLPTDEDVSGVAIDSGSHQAFISGENTSEIGLISLPTSKVTQLDSGMLSEVTATMPDDPYGDTWYTLHEPDSTSVVACSGSVYGLAVDDDLGFLATVDLAKFKANPSAVSTALPSGNCAGTGSSYSCKNHNGVTFFPLP
jgi:hypothetical protein